jgi:hypothetical protein
MNPPRPSLVKGIWLATIFPPYNLLCKFAIRGPQTTLQTMVLGYFCQSTDKDFCLKLIWIIINVLSILLGMCLSLWFRSILSNKMPHILVLSLDKTTHHLIHYRGDIFNALIIIMQGHYKVRPISQGISRPKDIRIKLTVAFDVVNISNYFAVYRLSTHSSLLQSLSNVLQWETNSYPFSDVLVGHQLTHHRWTLQLAPRIGNRLYQLAFHDFHSTSRMITPRDNLKSKGFDCV